MSKSNKTAYTRTEGEYETLERQLAEAISIVREIKGFCSESQHEYINMRLSKLKEKSGE